MTDQQPPKLPQADLRSQSTASDTDPDYVSMEGDGFSSILSHLLRKPLSIIHDINKGVKNPLSSLLLITLICLAVFGFVLGIFSTGQQLWIAPTKVIGGVFFSSLICFPSLYIFGCLGGMDAKIHQVAGLMLTFLAITSLLLIGFAPVVWLFSTSSNSLVFFGILSLLVWLISLVFGLRIISKATSSMGGSRGGHINVWMLIFTLVTLQMTTTLRPIIGTSDKFINLEQKEFFLGYWFKIMGDENKRERSHQQAEQTEQPENTNTKAAQ